MATTAPPLICPKGHGPGTPDSRFCTICGALLTAAAEPAQPAAQPASPWTPLNASAPASLPASVPATAPPPTSAQPTPSASPASFMPRPAAGQSAPCTACGGDGVRLSEDEGICTQCGWLRPLFPGYQLDRSVFLWAQDGQAMTKLQKITALNSVVRSISDKVGRPWIESTFNGIRLGPKQLPDVWKQAVLAARILGLPSMPDVYVAGDQMWTTYTFGTDKSAFIVLGTALLTNFQGDELLFVLAREMGHCAAGHALWKTATRFLAGDTSLHSGILSNGLLNAISPTKLIEGAVDMPLMAWSRQSDITADRAGLLAVGDEGLARRVLLAWSIRSSRLLKQINIEEWMKQEDASDDAMTRFSEMTTSASMYTTRRLRLLSEAASEAELMRWSQTVQPARKRLAPQPQPAPPQHPAPHPAASTPAPTSVPKPAQPTAPSDSIRVVCNKCQAAMRIPFAVLRGKSSLNVRCPSCQSVITLRTKAAAPSPAPAAAETKPAIPPAPAVAVTKPIVPPAPVAARKKSR